MMERAIALLRELSGPHGIHASLAASANYRAVFTRDAVMAGTAGLLLRDPIVTGALVRTLEALRALQGTEGQIASNFEPRADGPPAVSFGTLAPRIDSVPWYVIGVALAARAGALDPAPFRESVRRALTLLDALEYNGRHLLYVPMGGDWADEYVYDGYVLHDQVLRAWALRLAAAVHGEPAWRAKADRIADTIAARYARPGLGHPLAAFSPAGERPTFDLAATALLGVAGLAPAMAHEALAWVDATFLARGALPPAFHPVIREGDADWPALSRYHLHGFRNRPHEYHNGGIWPIWLGWLALALAGAGHDGAQERLRALVARALDAHPGFAFEEFLHGVTGAPGGTPRMAYSATGIAFLTLAPLPGTLTLLAT